jgi:hypothetical protein
MPNRLTGSTDKFCAYVRAATEPATRNDAIHASTYALICTTPRPTKTGPKFRTISRTCGDVAISETRSRPNTRNTTGNCTSICSALPATDPHASHTARSGNVERRPNQTSVAIIATFHTTGAAYERKNFL